MNGIMLIIFIALCVLYIVFGVALIIGLVRWKDKNVEWEPAVSIIIPARNEAENINRCLKSVSELDYPTEKLNVIIVDDHSDDDTVKIVESYVNRFQNFTILKLSDIPNSGDGKLAALIQGYRKANTGIILQTDADCIVPRRWIRSMVRQFDDTCGIVGGITVLRNFDKRNTCFTQIQSLDWLYLLSVGVGASGVGIPLSCIGNNLAVRKSAYDAAGGYENMPFTMTEDFALFQAIIGAGWKSGFVLDENALVHSRSPATFRSFLQQRLRWAAGGTKHAGPGIALLLTAFLFHVIVIFGIGLGLPVRILGSGLALTALVDFIFLYIAGKKVNSLSLLAFFPLFEIYYYVYTTVIGLIVPFSPSVLWKGRKVEKAAKLL